MKRILFIITLFLTLGCEGQNQKKEKYNLTISPIINKEDKINLQIIKDLNNFLITKNQSISSNNYWLESDFQKYIYPYYDIFNIENSKYGENFYKPTLLEIISTENENQKIVKIAFIGHHDKTNENNLKSIYNIIANIQKDKISFSSYL